ncbi:MFS transporter [Noviherbaspirillum malthae]|jgi:MFS family permease|uniref:MFS transporter n=1 Tax=Noviherbaspirillum malthae TaxID=1260987 RepID=UPI00188EDAC6|nr:MFS transporter [Noviherbaspirillum malthae]
MLRSLVISDYNNHGMMADHETDGAQQAAQHSMQSKEKQDAGRDAGMAAKPNSFVLPVLTGMMVTLVTVAFARLAFGLILPSMRADLGLSYQQAGTLVTAAALGYLFLVMVAGVFASRRGGRAAVVLGLSLATAGFILLAAGSQFGMLLLAMLMLGCGTAFAYTPVISLLAGHYPHRRGSVIGLTNSGIGIGMLSASLLVPYLGELTGQSAWRWAWGVFAVASMIALASSLSFLPNPRIAAPGAAAGSSASVYRDRRLILTGLLYGVVGTTYIAQTTFMFSYALASGIAAPTAGHLSALLGVLSIFAGPCWGLFSDRFGRPAALLISVALNVVATLLPVLLPTLTGFTLHYLILGCTVSGMFTSILTIAAESVEPRLAPRATSYVTLFYAVGQLAGPALAGLVIEYGGGFKPAFTASSAVLALGFLLSCKLVRLSRRTR